MPLPLIAIVIAVIGWFIVALFLNPIGRKYIEPNLPHPDVAKRFFFKLLDITLSYVLPSLVIAYLFFIYPRIDKTFVFGVVANCCFLVLGLVGDRLRAERKVRNEFIGRLLGVTKNLSDGDTRIISTTQKLSKYVFKLADEVMVLKGKASNMSIIPFTFMFGDEEYVAIASRIEKDEDLEFEIQILEPSHIDAPEKITRRKDGVFSAEHLGTNQFTIELWSGLKAACLYRHISLTINESKH